MLVGSPKRASRKRLSGTLDRSVHVATMNPFLSVCIRKESIAFSKADVKAKVVIESESLSKATSILSIKTMCSEDAADVSVSVGNIAASIAATDSPLILIVHIK